MSELSGSNFASVLRIDEVDRAHATAGFIDLALHDGYEKILRDELYGSIERSLELGPVEQAENILSRKAAEDRVTAELSTELEEVYNWNPDKAKTLTMQEFGELAGEFFGLKHRYLVLDKTHRVINATYYYFNKTGQLGGYTDNEGATWEFESVLSRAYRTLWAGEYGFATLLMAEAAHPEFVFKNAMKSYTDETYDYADHYDEYRAIDGARCEVLDWLHDAVKIADRERELAELTMCQYIMQHADPSTKAYKDAKQVLRSCRRTLTENVWNDYVADVRSWHSMHSIEQASPPEYVWNINEEELLAPDVEPTPPPQVLHDDEVADVKDLANMLDDFRHRSLDASIASRLIREGHTDKVVDNFHVFTGDTSGFARKLLRQEGLECTLMSLDRLHSLDNAFLRTLLDTWDAEWNAALEKGNRNRGYEWPLGLYYPTEKVSVIIDNLESFNSLSADMAFELVTRMYDDRDHGEDSIELIETMLSQIDRFDSFDRLEFAKHIKKEECIPHLNPLEVMAKLLPTLELPDTAETHEFIASYIESCRADEVKRWCYDLVPLNETNIQLIREKIGNPEFTPWRK